MCGCFTFCVSFYCCMLLTHCIRSVSYLSVICLVLYGMFSVIVEMYTVS